MSEPVQDPFPVDHSALKQPPESFRVVLDIDEKAVGIALTAFNAKSMIALLQILMIMNRRRISGYVVRTEGVLAGDPGKLVASVPFGSFYEQMVRATRLSQPAPKDVPNVIIDQWSSFRVKEQSVNPTAKKMVVEMVIDGLVEKFPVDGANEDSVIALFTAATCAQMPRISGWNLYNENGKLVVSVPAMIFLALLAEKSPLGKAPADPKAAGWRAVPAVAPTSEEWMKAMEAAKRAGKTPT